MNLSWGKVEKQLEQRRLLGQRGQLEQRWETDETVFFGGGGISPR